ncbi:MAG TPA: ThiF family adenylyltransferase [Chloroflexia bacterium]|nr:ThiF family adenylyltransferase [Chloroflexia bacterium]
MARTTVNPNSPFFHEERHASLEEIAGKPLTICGAGALGGNLAETLARMGFTQLKIIDRDRVEMRNLSTQPYFRAEVGAPKARALANSLYRAVGAKIEPVTGELTEANAQKLLAGSALVVDALDNRAGRAAVSGAALALQVPCLHIGFSGDGLYGNGLWEPNYRIPGESAGDPCDYPLTRPLVLAITALATRAITRFLRDGSTSDFELTLNDFKASF